MQKETKRGVLNENRRHCRANVYAEGVRNNGKQPVHAVFACYLYSAQKKEGNLQCDAQMALISTAAGLGQLFVCVRKT